MKNLDGVGLGSMTVLDPLGSAPHEGDVEARLEKNCAAFEVFWESRLELICVHLWMLVARVAASYAGGYVKFSPLWIVFWSKKLRPVMAWLRDQL
jgi:hypothetical protein